MDVLTILLILWCLSGVTLMASGLIRFTISDMTGQEPGWFKAIVWLGCCVGAPWYYIKEMIKRD